MRPEIFASKYVVQRVGDLRPALERRGVAHISLFGSVARGDATSLSDVDLLVELARPLGLEFFELEAFVADAIGAPVELTTRSGLRPRALVEAEKDLVPIF